MEHYQEAPEQVAVSMISADNQYESNAFAVNPINLDNAANNTSLDDSSTNDRNENTESSKTKLEKILERTGYPHQKTSQQHIYGPPPGKENIKLPAGVQIHVGKLSYNALEDSLIEVFEQAGEIYELRLMMDPKTGKNKGFAFVTFCTKEAADNAVKMFNNYSIHGKNISVVIASSNNTLFIGSIPKTKSREEIRIAFSNEVAGIVDVLLQPSLKTTGSNDKNRGFCFLNFEDYKSAAAARQALRSSKVPIKLWNDYKAYTCDWADPVEEISEDVMKTVKTLFVKNISERTTESVLRDRFSQYGPIDKIVVHKHYAFVFFADRADALKAIDGENDKVLEDTTLSVELAKPISEDHRRKIRDLKERRNETVGPPSYDRRRDSDMNRRGPRSYGPSYERRDPYDMYYGSPGYGMPPPHHDHRGRPGGYSGHPPPGPYGYPPPTRGGPPPMKRSMGPPPGPPSKRGRDIQRYPAPPPPAPASYGHYASGYEYPPCGASYGGYDAYAAAAPPPPQYPQTGGYTSGYGGATYEDFTAPPYS